VNFNTFDTTTKEFAWRLQIGNDERLVSASEFPGQGIRQMYQQAVLDNTVFRNSNTSSTRLAGGTITQGFRAMPRMLLTY
jgi:hypothetical protein